LNSIPCAFLTLVLPLDHSITQGDAEEGHSAILFGDDGGFVNILYIPKRFWSETVSEMTPLEDLTPQKLLKKNNNRNQLYLIRKKVLSDWITKIVYNHELNSFICCSPDREKSIVIGDMDRRTIRFGAVQKGVMTFDICKRPSFIVTGGRDKVLRVWNPYVLSKPASILTGHTSAILSITINPDTGHVFSLSEDKILKVWDTRSLSCIQSIEDHMAHRPEDTISCLTLDKANGRLFLGSDVIDSLPVLYSVVYSDYL
jgi:WD40 repeat protein